MNHVSSLRKAKVPQQVLMHRLHSSEAPQLALPITAPLLGIVQGCDQAATSRRCQGRFGQPDLGDLEWET